MKFKTIFIIFNIVIIFSFLFIFFMPLILLGGEHFSAFFLKNWLIGILFLTTLGLFNLYFINNWMLFGLLEKEDWAALIRYLEKRIYEEKSLRSHYVKILINSYLVTSNLKGIMKLQNELSGRKPSLIQKHALQFGIPYLLDNKPEESEKYFGKLLSSTKVRDVLWIRWNYAFSILQLKQAEGAKIEFLKLLDFSKEPIVCLLSLYLLNSFPASDVMLRVRVDAKINDFRRSYSTEQWKTRLERSKENIEVLILSKIIKEASDWIFEYKPSAENQTVH